VPIYHQGEASSRHIKARRLSYYLHSRIRYAFKHFPSSEAWLLLLCTMTIEFFSRMIYGVMSRSMSRITETVKGYCLFLKTMLSQGVKL
jgi:GT2 family glycosyltransferase